MTTLKLHGYFAYFDRYGKMKFRYCLDDTTDTRAKLERLEGPDLSMPFNTMGFTVCLPKKLGSKDDLQAMVSHDCVLYVKTRRYTFEGRNGLSLTLTDIELDPKY